MARDNERLGRMAVQQAKEKWGKGWDGLSSQMKQGAVALELAYMLMGQANQQLPIANFTPSVQYALNAVDPEASR